jgi:CRISPR-associated protein Cmr3
MLYFALPADVVAIEKNGNRFKPLMPGPKHSDDVIGNAAELEQILLPPDNIEPQKFRPGYVVQSEFEKYLTGQDFVQTPADQLFVSETRPGNAVDTGKQVTREGMLFLVDFIRPLAGVGLHVDLAAGLAELQANGMLRLGGEGHVGKFDEKPLAKPLALPHIGEQHHAGKRFKVVFLTPGYFSAGWQPNSWDTHFVGGKVKCVCAALQRYISVGGFDLTQPKMGHKPALRYVDAGSVYFFEIVEGTPQLKNDWLCDSSPDSATLGQIGFGQVAIGNW